MSVFSIVAERIIDKIVGRMEKNEKFEEVYFNLGEDEEDEFFGKLTTEIEEILVDEFGDVIRSSNLKDRINED